MDSIRKHCKGGPPHHDHSAQQIEYSDNAPSRIFVTTQESGVQLPANRWQEIFRHRHILQKSNLDHPRIRFDRQALIKLGSLTAQRDIQGLYQLSQRCIVADINIKVNGGKLTSYPVQTQAGMLLDLLPGLDGKSKRGLGVNQIPMGGSNIPKPPLHRSICISIFCSRLMECVVVSWPLMRRHGRRHGMSAGWRPWRSPRMRWYGGLPQRRIFRRGPT